MYRNNFNANGYLGGYAPAGYNFNPQQQAPKFTNPLTNEEIKMLRQKGEKFTLGLTQEEQLRGVCFHRDQNGDTLVPNPDGTVRCTVCGHVFDPVNGLTKEELEAAVAGVTDILQTIKMLYLDMPEEAAREYFQIIPLINKIPQLYERAAENFSRHENVNTFRFNGAPSASLLYNMLGSGSFNPGMMGGFQQQPMMGQPMMGQPMMGQQPMMNQPYMNQPVYGQQPMMGAAPMPGSNGFGYTQAPPTGYQPGTNPGYQYQPGQEQPTGQTPAATVASTDGAEVNVNAQFKA